MATGRLYPSGASLIASAVRTISLLAILQGTRSIPGKHKQAFRRERKDIAPHWMISEQGLPQELESGRGFCILPLEINLQENTCSSSESLALLVSNSISRVGVMPLWNWMSPHAPFYQQIELQHEQTG